LLYQPTPCSSTGSVTATTIKSQSSSSRLIKTCSQIWPALLIDCPFLLGCRKEYVNKGGEDDQVDCCCWFCRTRRNLGASNNACANYSTGRQHDHASSLGMRPV